MPTIASPREVCKGRVHARRWHWRWGFAALSAYALASGAYIAAFMTPNTSWEHHPFAGPLVALYESRHPAEFAISLTIWCGLGMGLCWPTFRPSMPAILISVASVVVWVVLGVWTASVAAC
jgi:hypothetical protein